MSLFRKNRGGKDVIFKQILQIEIENQSYLKAALEALAKNTRASSEMIETMTKLCRTLVTHFEEEIKFLARRRKQMDETAERKNLMDEEY
jgi:hypothetical protein